MEKDRLRRKLKELEEMQKENEDLEGEIEKMERLKEEVKESLAQYHDIEDLTLPELRC